MNLGITITSTVLVLLVVTPVVLIQQQQKKKSRNLLKALKTLANTHNCSITKYDVFKNFAIGLDKQNNTLFFYKKSSSKAIKQHINLNEVKSCGVFNSKKTTHENVSGDTVKLELILNSVESSSNNKSIELYNQTEDFELNGELEIVSKWKHIIHNTIK